MYSKSTMATQYILRKIGTIVIQYDERKWPCILLFSPTKFDPHVELEPGYALARGAFYVDKAEDPWRGFLNLVVFSRKIMASCVYTN